MPRHLNRRQVDIAALVAKGHASKEIAFRTGLTYGSVKVYISAILQILGVSNRTELAVWVMKHNDLFSSGQESEAPSLGGASSTS